MDQTLDEALAELRLEFIASLREALTITAAHLEALAREPAARLPLVELRRLFHRLAGSGGTYGLPRISELGLEGERLCEARLNAAEPVDTEDLDNVRALLDAVQRELDRASEAEVTAGAAAGETGAGEGGELTHIGEEETVPVEPGPSTEHLLVVTARADLRFVVEAPEVMRGRIHLADRPEQVDQLLRAHPLGAAVVDLELLGARDYLEQLRGRVEIARAPLLAMASAIAPAARVELAQLGVDRFISPEASLGELWASARDPHWQGTAPGLALLVTGDSALAAQVSADLAAATLAVEVIAEPAALIERCLERPPHLVLLDAETAGDGGELVGELRQRIELLATPLWLLARDPDPGRRQTALELGVDRVLQLPYHAGELGACARRLLGVAELLRNRATAPVETPVAAAAVPVAPALALAGEPVRVLVADDDPNLRALIEHHLQRLGWEVVLAADGMEAERALTQQAYHIALLDVMMPFRSGFDLLEWINDHRRHRPLKVVILTALGQDENLLRAFDLGADDFIAKPVSPEAVTGRLRRLLRPA